MRLGRNISKYKSKSNIMYSARRKSNQFPTSVVMRTATRVLKELSDKGESMSDYTFHKNGKQVSESVFLQMAQDESNSKR